MFEKIRDMLASELDLDIDRITPDSDIMDDLGADSLDLVEFITELEAEFGVVIPQDELEDVRTVSQVADLIEEHLD